MKDNDDDLMPLCMDVMKPCPFCGGCLIIEEDYSADNMFAMYYIVCKSCGVTSGYYENRDVLIEKWNCRDKRGGDGGENGMGMLYKAALE